MWQPIRYTIWFWPLLLWGCASQDMSRNLYHGVKARNEALQPAQPAARKTPSYEDYERARRARRALSAPVPR